MVFVSGDNGDIDGVIMHLWHKGFGFHYSDSCVRLCHRVTGPWPFYKMAFKAMNEANKNAECMPLKLNMYLLKWLETYLRQMCALCEVVFGKTKTNE